MSQKYRVGIVGASGYTGVELVRLVARHEALELCYLGASQSAGVAMSTSWPGLTGLCDLPIETFDVQSVAGRCDVVFLALPHGIAAKTAPVLLDAGVIVVDLGADFRLKDPAIYERHYKMSHPCPERLETAVYGLVELNREALKGARLIANPGCYPTAVSLACYPLIAAGMGGDWLVADCVSGVSGAGRTPGKGNMFAEVAESVRAYGFAGSHRHVPEIEQILGCSITFTPHLVPMIRGMVATVHARPGRPVSLDAVRGLYEDRYRDETMIVLRDDVPSTADVRGSNRAHVHVGVDTERGVVSSTCVIDNLIKGASGQAVQALNVALGLDEAAGLPLFPLLP